MVSTTAIILKSSTAAVDKPSVSQENIKLFPNPAKENLNISIGSQIPAMTDISVLSQDGKLIDSVQYNYDGSTPMKIDTGKFCNGLYLLRIKDQNFTDTKKFCIFK